MSLPNYNLEWEIFNFEDGLRAGFDQKYIWYMIFLKHKGIKKLTRPELVYIGMTLESVSDRLLNKHEAIKSVFREMDRSIEFAFGFWVGGGKSKNQKTITEAEMKDIEAAMIANFKPRLNGAGVKGYTGKAIGITSYCEIDSAWSELNFEIDYQ